MPRPKRAVVAMSGGVDSSVAAALLVEQGYEVIGLMLRLWGEADDRADNRCCTPEAVEDARCVARALGISFHLLNCESRFRTHVVDHFVRAYADGLTPNPCLSCNRHIKFGYLLQLALSLDAEYLATGHYARVHQTNGAYRLLRGLDERKDQSYVLYMLGQEQLQHVLFPIGEYTKLQVREMATGWGLPVAGKPDSQDLCFVRANDYRQFLRSYAPEVIWPGPILDSSGRQIGQHSGLPLYTIGQRRGLGIAWSEALYVLDLDPGRNALVVGPASELGWQGMQVADVAFVRGSSPHLPAHVTTKIRYTGTELAATLCAEEAGAVRVRLSAPARDITPGQAAVFYQGEVVLGGGVIAGRER